MPLPAPATQPSGTERRTSSRLEYDMVCVGGGLGGLAAAARAASRGLRVVVIESSQYLGGGAGYSGGLVWAPGRADGDPPDSIDAANTYLSHIDGERHSDGSLRRQLLATAQEALDFYRSLGIGFEIVPGNPDVYYPDAPGSIASGRMHECVIAGSRLGELRSRLIPSPHYRIGLRNHELFGGLLPAHAIEDLFEERQRDDLLTLGSGLAGAFLHAALIQHDVDWIVGSRAVALLQRSGRVTGVRATLETGARDGPAIDVTARGGVLLATGGYGWAEYAADLEGLPDFAEAGPPTICGDHVQLAESAGAGLVRGAGPQFCLGAHVQAADVHPDTDVKLTSQLFDVLGHPHTAVVNRSGKRFGDESYYVGINRELCRWDGAQGRWPNFPCFLIFDEQFRRKYPLATLPAGAHYPESIARAGTLNALAEAIVVDGTGLSATIDEFNAHAIRGVDPQFGRGSKPFVRRRYGDPFHTPNPNLGTVEEPPFYALPLRLLGTGMCTFGLRTDQEARVLRRDGSAIPGLFATGNAVATTEFRGYITGYANMRNMAMAYRAASVVGSN